MVQKIRMLKSVAQRYQYIPEGTVLHIPQDIDEATAQSWLKAGLAAEDKMIDGPFETKAGKSAKKKRS